MPENKLEPDQDALDEWEKMPKNDPSKDALPPATGGFPQWLAILIGLVIVIAILSLLQT